MNTLQLVLKNMRQRALSTWLTTLSVALGVALAIAVIIFHREGDKLFVQSDFGYNVLVGPKGDEMRLIFNSVYGLGSAQGSIPWAVYQDLMVGQQQNVRWALPFMVGDTWQGKRIMATAARIVGSPELAAFRDALSGLPTDLRTVGRPAIGESGHARPARLAKVPAVVKAARDRIAALSAETLAPLDVDLVARFQDLRGSLDRAAAMIDPANLATVDAAGRIAADAVDQLRLLGGFAAPFEYRAGRPLTLAQGHAFDARKFEGVIGSSVAAKLNMTLGDVFRLEHGGNAKDVHDETWAVCGILAPTGTAIDETLFIPLVSGLSVPEHEAALESIARLTNPDAAPSPPAKRADAHDHDHGSELIAPARPGGHDHAAHDGHDHHDHAYHLEPDGRIDLHLTPDKWKVSGIFVGTRGEGAATAQLQFRFMNTPTAMAVNPARKMAEFFGTFLKGPTYVLLALAVLVTVVAAVSILVSIYNAVSARKREIAILRALGATRQRVLSLICCEAAIVGLFGAVVGLVLGHLLAAAGSRYLESSFGHRVAAWTVSPYELYYVAGVVLIAAIAGLVPAVQAYRTSVAQNLVSE